MIFEWRSFMEKPNERRPSTKIQWHPAFCAAAELELRFNKDDLEFKREYNLSKKPLQMDLLIIEKRKGVQIQNEIGKIFRGHNIIEYKSPDAFLYKGLGEKVNQIPLRELTVSLFRASAPKELLNQISKEGYIIERQSPGIYYVNGLSVPTQIVVTNELNSKNHESLKVLSKSAQTDDIQRFTELASAFTEPGDKEKADAVLQVSVAANRKNYDKVRRTSDMCEALRELMKEEIEEELKKSRDKAIQEGLAQGLAQGLEQGIEQGIEQGLEQGIEQGIEQGRINQLIDLVMQNLLPIETAAQCAKMTLDEFKVAMDKNEN